MKHASLALVTFAVGLIACADPQTPVTPRLATLDGAVTTASPATTAGSGRILHDASGGGTVVELLFPSSGGTGGLTSLPIAPAGTKVTYSVSARQMDDGSFEGHVFVRFPDGVKIRGDVGCLIVDGNRAFIAGELTPPISPSVHTFGVALEDNGEGSKASAPDRVGPLFVATGTPLSICFNALFAREVLELHGENWTNGNVQVR